MDRPYIICHMLTSLDGKIIGDFLNEDRTAYFIQAYEEIDERYECKAWMCGRITMEEHFTQGNTLELKSEDILAIPRMDYVAQKTAKSYAVAVDPSGKLGWTTNSISKVNDDQTGDHIIEVLTEQVPDAYLNHLRQLGISYIFGGKDKLDFNLVVKKLKSVFSIDELLLEGGGFVNGSLLSQGLIDELSLILVPIADGASKSVTLFETGAYLQNSQPVNFFLKSIEKLDDDGLWIRYLTKKSN
ncbi:RibD family protein [Paenibacillus odorifer]|uniref:RibD family protein n=1 Tax=Paenibacillus odorifer TaxID=189426 RepID=UPI002897EDF6|nr:RibD family protein [Paenibacillus odorifer]